MYGRFIKDTNGDAVVEATILFPIMIMIFAALVLLAVFLPARALLQRATQYAATAIATELSDTWLFFGEEDMSYYWETEKSRLANVYIDIFSGTGNVQSKGDHITSYIESLGISSKMGELNVESYVVDRVFYKEIVVTATRYFPITTGLSFIRFPDFIPVTATSTAVVQNADEFVRSVDIASDFIDFIIEKYDLHDIADTISTFGGKVASLLGWE
jgi:hypothetical protein